MRAFRILAAVVIGLLGAAAGAAPFAGASVVLCDGQIATIIGSSVINGTPGPDVIVGSPGPDTIKGNGGDDLICGGNGDDRINGNSGNDRIFGEADVDTIAGDAGDDYLNLGTEEYTGGGSAKGGTGNDVLTSQSSTVNCLNFRCSGAPLLDGGAGNDTIDVSGGHLIGGSGDDQLTGAGLLEGGSGDDIISAPFGFAELLGGSGDDSLASDSSDAQRLNGSSGFDQCSENGPDQLISCEVVS